jgi:hypothetical protein
MFLRSQIFLASLLNEGEPLSFLSVGIRRGVAPRSVSTSFASVIYEPKRETNIYKGYI